MTEPDRVVFVVDDDALLAHNGLAKWAENCPETFGNRVALVMAELTFVAYKLSAKLAGNV